MTTCRFATRCARLENTVILNFSPFEQFFLFVLKIKKNKRVNLDNLAKRLRKENDEMKEELRVYQEKYGVLSDYDDENEE